MKLIFKVAVLALAASTAVGSLKADVVYDNGPINGTEDAWNFSDGFSVSSSFTAPAGVSLTSATVGLWADDTPASLSWSIGTTAFGMEISSGIATLSSTLIGSAFGFSVFESSFNLAGVVGAGTYYLTLSGGLDFIGASLFWDINNGPSTAYELPDHPFGTADTIAGFPGSNSPSFTIFGESETEPGPEPEPGAVPDVSATLALLFVGMAMVHGLRHRLA